MKYLLDHCDHHEMDVGLDFEMHRRKLSSGKL